MVTDLIAIIGLGLGEIPIYEVMCLSRLIVGMAVGLNSALVCITYQFRFHSILKSTHQ